MSNLNMMNAPIANGRPTDGRQVVGTYTEYGAAQQAVDRLSDAEFPIASVEIVGHDLSLVELVTGRWTTARATVAGAGTGAWFGLFIGLLVGLFTTGPVWAGLVLGGLLIGALWGAAFGFFAHWATHGQRDFASAHTLIAERYEVLVLDAHAQRARLLLAEAR